MGATPTVRREDLVRLRFRRHALDRPPGDDRAALPELLDQGVQDTGHDGAAWALAVRGAPRVDPDELVLAWTLRGAPHAYRRADLPAVAVATAPYDEEDAAKRVFDASKPLRAAGIAVLDALRTIATEMRSIVRSPTVKGELSTALTGRLDEPYLRECRPCQAVHAYENPFRLAALQAGLVLDWGTSPPVVRRAPGLTANRYRRLAGDADDRFDVVRGHLRFFPGAAVRDVAGFLDAPQEVVRARWPDDAVAVEVTGTAGGPRAAPRFVLEGDLDGLGDTGPGGADPSTRLLGPYDPYLQLRDRELLVDDEARRKDLWRVLGRPGAVVVDGEIVGTWRPRTARGRLTVAVEPWTRWTRGRLDAVAEQAERLAVHRGVPLAGVES